MSFFGKMFGSDEEEDKRTILEHPDQLRKGDIVKFGFLPQQELSNQRFEVAAVNTYDFDGEKNYSLTLKGEKNNRLWLSITREDGEDYLSISKKLSRGDVKTLFGDSEFGAIFEEGAGTELNRKDVNEELVDWTVPHYTEEEDCSKGYYHEGDYRDRTVPQYEDESIALDYYLLEDDEGEFAIEIEVYSDGDTEVCATIYHELSAIDEMWPGEEK